MAKKKEAAGAAETAPAAYVTLEREASVEMVEKKSVFIGHAKPVKTGDEAVEFINKIRGKYPDATHNVYAYMIGANVTRYSDDGEPVGTAGLPVLEVIRKTGFTDACIVVTRYFGGILLGAGGLVRAYSAAAKLAADEAHIVSYVEFTEFRAACNYADFQKIDYELPRFGVKKDGVDFGAQIVLSLAVRKEQYAEFALRLSEMTAGRVIPEITGSRLDQ